jgi:chromosome segregation ATPase
MLTFISNLVGVKADKAMQAGVEALVRWDPQSASEAELRTMEQHLDDLGRQVATARQSYDREKREADAIQALSQQRMAAAEQLQRQIDAEPDATRKAQLEHSLETLVTMLEQMTPEIEREKKDAVDAKDFLEMLEKTYAEAGGKLRQGRSELERARRDMARAGQQRTVAEQQAEAARRAAGLTSATSSMTVALKAMHEAAARDLASADAATAKAKLLRPTQPEHDDPNIAAALAAVSGKPSAPQSLTDRLAALKTQSGH